MVKPGIYKHEQMGHLYLNGKKQEGNNIAENYGGTSCLLDDKEMERISPVFTGEEYYVDGFDDPKMWVQQLMKKAKWLEEKALEISNKQKKAVSTS